MAKIWLEERWGVLIPALSSLGSAQEAEIARLCQDEIAAWKERPSIKKFTALRPIMTATRNAIKAIPLTPDNRYKDGRTGEWQHIALKHMNFTDEEWNVMNAVSEQAFQARLEDQQFIDHPTEVVARAEALLHSDRWDDLVTGLAIVTGRRLTELLKTGRFFPKSQYTVTFDGQLKRKDLQVKPYEIPVLVDAELVIAAWRRLRSLEDTTKLDNEEVAQKYSRQASENAVRLFEGLVPRRSSKEDLYTHAFRAVYARVAVFYYCPVSINQLVYANAILGQYQAHNESQIRDFLTTAHYFDYQIGDGAGQIDGRQGIKLGDPGVTVLEIFEKKGATMNTITETQEQGTVLETKPAKKRGALTTKPGTFDRALQMMEERNMHGTGAHDRLVADLMSHDAIAHQMYALLTPLAGDLGTEGPVATLQALINGYQTGDKASPDLSQLIGSVRDEGKDPAAYLKMLVERDRKFQTSLDNRHTKVDYSTASMADLRSKIKTPEAAIERFKRAVNAIIAHNNAQTDPLHLWFINATSVRDLVGGRNDNIQDYLETRKDEIEAHHAQYSLTARQNRKQADIAQEILF